MAQSATCPDGADGCGTAVIAALPGIIRVAIGDVSTTVDCATRR